MLSNVQISIPSTHGERTLHYVNCEFVHPWRLHDDYTFKTRNRNRNRNAFIISVPFSLSPLIATLDLAFAGSTSTTFCSALTIRICAEHHQQTAGSRLTGCTGGVPCSPASAESPRQQNSGTSHCASTQRARHLRATRHSQNNRSYPRGRTCQECLEAVLEPEVCVVAGKCIMREDDEEEASLLTNGLLGDRW
jgi:hypothetical protein